MDVGTIIGKTFSKRFRGIAPDEVDFFLREVADYVNRLQKQIAQLEQKIRDTGNVVKESSPPVREPEQPEPAGSVETQDEAQKIIRDAEEKAARLLEQSVADLAKIRESIVILEAKQESIGTRLKMLLQSELDLIQSLEAETDSPGHLSGSPGTDETISMVEVEEIIKTLDAQQ